MANKVDLKVLRQGVDSWNHWRNGRINPPELSEANLNGMVLSAVNLRQANLSGADLSRAHLSYADLSGAYLVGAALTGADLFGADLSGADLRGSDLQGANLALANLRSVNLERTNLSNSNMRQTILSNIDLRQVVGLDQVCHDGPSILDIDVIYKSQGKIPEVFLRGVGVPDSFIANSRALVAAMSPVQFYSCFISYSHEDKIFARRIYRELEDRGIRCWLDEHQLLPGDDMYHEVDQGIRLWDKLLLCCSKHSLTSWWVDNEIGTAFEKEQQLTKSRGVKVQVLIPLNLDGFLFSSEWASGYQSQIRRRLAADFTETGSYTYKFSEQLTRLLGALRADKEARTRPPKPKL